VSLARWRINRLRRLGALRRRAGDLRGAERAYRRALAIAEHHLTADGLAAARCRNDLGVVLKYTGGFDEAAFLYEWAHGVFVARLGAAHPDVAMVLHNIGGLAHARGRPAEGEPAARLAVSIRAAALGDEHPATATDRAALAAILADMGNHGEAGELLEHALAVFQRRLGAMHHEVGVTLGSLGTIDAQRGDFRSAERRLRLALAIKQRTLGAHHPELVPTLGTLSSSCRRNGNDADARKFCRRAIDLLDRQGLTEHPHATSLRAHLAGLDAPSDPQTRADRSVRFAAGAR
jgi:tetratricopeptide (TPR) repeat protein